ELGREFREGQLLLIDDRRIPGRVEVGRLAEPRNLHIVAALVAALARVEWLVEVADEMNDEAQRKLLVGAACVWIFERGAELGECLERVALRRRMVVGNPVDRHIMPWA